MLSKIKVIVLKVISVSGIWCSRLSGYNCSPIVFMLLIVSKVERMYKKIALYNRDIIHIIGGMNNSAFSQVGISALFRYVVFS